MSTVAPERVFRPWNTDSIGVIVRESPAAITIAYEHDPSKEYTISRRDLAGMGRFVTR